MLTAVGAGMMVGAVALVAFDFIVGFVHGWRAQRAGLAERIMAGKVALPRGPRLSRHAIPLMGAGAVLVVGGLVIA